MKQLKLMGGLWNRQKREEAINSPLEKCVVGDGNHKDNMALDHKPPLTITTPRIPYLVYEDEYIAIVHVPSHHRPFLWHEITIDKITNEWTCDCQSHKKPCIDIKILRWYGRLKTKRKRGVQQTSKIAYYMLSDGDLGNRQQRVYMALKKLGSATDKQIAEYLGWPINTVTPRRGELYSLFGLIMPTTHIIDPKTRMPCTVWTVI